MPHHLSVSWICNVCRQRRPDQFISVRRIDLSADFHAPPETIMQNTRYCNDRPYCIAQAPHVRLISPNDTTCGQVPTELSNLETLDNSGTLEP